MVRWRDKLIKCVIWIGFFVVVVFTYRFVSLTTFQRSHELSLLTSLDTMIPFIPESVFFYISFYLFWLPPALSNKISIKEFWRLVGIVMIGFFVTFAFHLWKPSSYPRPEISDNEILNDWSAYIVKKIIYWDLPNNTFPSSHVMTVMLWMLFTSNKAAKWPFRFYCTWGILVIFSTLTVKQHYLVDVLASVVIAVSIYYLSKRKYWEILTKKLLGK